MFQSQDSNFSLPQRSLSANERDSFRHYNCTWRKLLNQFQFYKPCQRRTGLGIESRRPTREDSTTTSFTRHTGLAARETKVAQLICTTVGAGLGRTNWLFSTLQPLRKTASGIEAPLTRGFSTVEELWQEESRLYRSSADNKKLDCIGALLTTKNSTV